MSSNESVIIPITGAMNPLIGYWRPAGLGLKKAIINPGGLLFAPMHRAFEDHGIPVESAVVLPRHGIQHPEATYREVEEQVERRRARNPGRRAILVAHSLGGLMAARMVAQDPEQERILGGITLGSPHDGYNEKYCELVFGPYTRVLQAVGLIDRKGLDDNLEDFRQGTLAAAQRNSCFAGRLHVAGSPNDRAVDIESAVFPLPSAAQYVLSPTPPDDPEVKHIETAGEVGHLGLLISKEVIDFVIYTAAQYIENKPQGLTVI
jgi:pimeloyl-ACP methyl ester carboxylesterase